MKTQSKATPKPGDTAASRTSGLTQELKPEWVQHTIKIERLSSTEIAGAEDQPIGRADLELRMSIVLAAESPIAAVREALMDFVEQLD